MNDKCPICGRQLWTVCQGKMVYTFRYCPYCTEHDEADLRRQLSAANAVIAKLPKCWRLLDGKLVQDVSVVPGMEVWMPDEGAGPAEGFVSMDYISNVRDTGQVELRWSDSGSNGPAMNSWRLSTTCYSTREAAQAAAREKEAGNE